MATQAELETAVKEYTRQQEILQTDIHNLFMDTLEDRDKRILALEARGRCLEMENDQLEEQAGLYSICKRDLEEMRRNFMAYRRKMEALEKELRERILALEGQACGMQEEVTVTAPAPVYTGKPKISTMKLESALRQVEKVTHQLESVRQMNRNQAEYIQELKDRLKVAERGTAVYRVPGQGEIARSLAQAIDWVLCDEPERAEESIKEALQPLEKGV